MRIQTSQLKTGYILLEDVLGKSGHPIIKKKTVLTEEHINILHLFLVSSVEAAPQNMNSKRVAAAKPEPHIKEKQQEAPLPPKEKCNFNTQYRKAVAQFKSEYQSWNNGVPINIASVRNIIIPLLEKTEKIDFEVFTLHDFADKEEYIYHHSVAVSVLSAFLGKESGFSKGEWLQAGVAGILADAGMTRIEEDILTHVGPLTENQLHDIRNHPVYSYRMIENLPSVTQAIKSAVIEHHERSDGSGYPAGLSTEKIHPFAKILAVSDTYHAMVSERSYKEKIPIFKAVEELQKLRYSKLDSQVIHTFIKSLTSRSLGKYVRLSDGLTGEIVFIDENNPTRPFVKLDTSNEIINLQMNSQLNVKEFIKNKQSL